jgi:hypothetical protein
MSSLEHCFPNAAGAHSPRFPMEDLSGRRKSPKSAAADTEENFSERSVTQKKNGYQTSQWTAFARPCEAWAAWTTASLTAGYRSPVLTAVFYTGTFVETASAFGLGTGKRS